MKKTKRLLGGSILLAATLLFTSCQKEADQVPVNTTAEISNQAVITKINSWLEKKKVDADDDGDMKIEALKAKLDFSALHLEKYKQNDRLVVVPLKNDFKSINNEDKNPVNYLVAVLPESEDITKGNIIQYVSATGKKQVPRNTFSKIFNYEDLDCNGQFTVLSVTDDFRYELKFENNKLKSVAEPRSKSESEELRTNACIDWYLVTTTYFNDGTSQSNWTYLYTTCICEQTRIINGRNYRVNCKGGGAGDIIDYDLAAEAALLNEAFSISSSPIQRIITFTSETMAEVPFQWDVVKNITNTWRVTSYDVANGYNSNNAGAIIYNIRHLSSSISGVTILYRIPRGGTGPHIPLSIMSWEERSVSTSVASNYKSGTVYVSGMLKNFGADWQNVNNNCTVAVR